MFVCACALNAVSKNLFCVRGGCGLQPQEPHRRPTARRAARRAVLGVAEAALKQPDETGLR